MLGDATPLLRCLGCKEAQGSIVIECDWQVAWGEQKLIGKFLGMRKVCQCADLGEVDVCEHVRCDR